MVAGMQKFRAHFRGFDQAFVLIGGVACDAWMSNSALTFRKTKDLDIVLVIEALDSSFVERFKDFVQAGGYEERQRQQTGTRELYRFFKPKEADYPFMLELFSRAPVGIELRQGQQITPVATESAVASLSAILMDDDYYKLVVAARYLSDGIAMLGAEGLIPLKAKAYLDLQAQKDAGGNVDEADVKKHRNDVFRLALTLSGRTATELAASIRNDLKTFLDRFPEGSADWPAIENALRSTLRSIPMPAPSELLRTLSTFFRLD